MVCAPVIGECRQPLEERAPAPGAVVTLAQHAQVEKREKEGGNHERVPRSRHAVRRPHTAPLVSRPTAKWHASCNCFVQLDGEK